MGEDFQKSQGKEGFFYLPFFSLFLSSWMRVQTVRSEQHLQARFAMCLQQECVCVTVALTHTHSTYEREGKSNNKGCGTFQGGGRIPCLVYRNGREGTDECEGKGFIFRKDWKQNLWRMSRKQDRVWEHRILQPRNQSTIPLSGRWNAEALCTVSPECEVNLYLRCSQVSFCIEG